MRATTHHERSSAAIALLLVQLVVGYEWLVSGLTKIVHGDFPSGLGAAVAEMGKGSSGWYGSFLTGTIEPHGALFGYAIEWSELVAGVILLVGAALSLHLGGRLTGRPAAWLSFATVAAVVVGLVLAVNFELANGGAFGTHLASDSFDEGVDLDTIIVALQLVLLVPAMHGLRLRAQRRGSVSSATCCGAPGRLRTTR